MSTKYSHQDVFEDSDVTVNVRLKKGRSKGQQARFILREPLGKELATVTADVANDWLKGQSRPTLHFPPLKDVQPQKFCYTAEIHVEHAGKTYPLNKRFTVWPREVVVKATRKQDNKAYPGVRFRLMQDQEVTASGLTNARGEWTAMLPEPAFFEVDVAAPYSADWQTSTSATEVKAICDVAGFIAEIRQPDTSVASKAASPDLREAKCIKQMVNVQTGAALPGGDGHGRVVAIVVGGKGDRFRPREDRHARQDADHKVHVKVEFENPTTRIRPARRVFLQHDAASDTYTALDGEKRSGKDSDPKQTVEGEVAIGADGTATFYVALGLGGGERCIVHVGSTDKCEDDTLTFETWRKLWAQVTSFKDAWPKDQRSMVTDCYRDVFIDLEVIVECELKEDDPRLPPGTVVKSEQIGEKPGKTLVAMGKLKDSDQPVANKVANWDLLHDNYYDQKIKDKGNLGLHILVCDRTLSFRGTTMSIMLDGTDKSLGATPDERVQALRKKHQITWPPTGEKIFGFKRRPRDIKKGFLLGGVTFGYKAEDGSTSPIRMLKVVASPGGSTVEPIAQYVHVNGKNEVFVRCPPSAESALRQGKQVWVDLKVDVYEGLSGLSNGQNLTISQLADGITEAMNTIIHEIGHGIGMCATIERVKGDRTDNYTYEQSEWVRKRDAAKRKNDPFNDPEPVDEFKFGYKKDRLPDIRDIRAAHGRWHDDARGGTGNHCADGISESSYNNPKHNIDTWCNKVRCVIYAGVQSFTPDRWCERCRKILIPMEIFTGQKEIEWGWEEEINDGKGSTSAPPSA